MLRPYMVIMWPTLLNPKLFFSSLQLCFLYSYLVARYAALYKCPFSGTQWSTFKNLSKCRNLRVSKFKCHIYLMNWGWSFTMASGNPVLQETLWYQVRNNRRNRNETMLRKIKISFLFSWQKFEEEDRAEIHKRYP